MAKTLHIPDFSLVVVLAKQADHAKAMIERLVFHSPIHVTTNKPEEAKSKVLDALATKKPGALHLANSHPKIRQSMIRSARRSGAHPVVICIGETETVDESEDFRFIYDIQPDDIASLEISRVRMPNDLRHVAGGFDIIGDIHGCAEEFGELLVELGHARASSSGMIELIPHAEGRRVCLVGDLTDRGPDNQSVLEIARALHERFGAIIALGNHDDKLRRWLRGGDVEIGPGLQRTVDELQHMAEGDRHSYADWIEDLRTHYILDDGALIIAHAGLKEEFHGVESNASRAFALFGERTGENDETGRPIAVDWAADYAGQPLVVHGHVVTREPRRVNNVIAIDTGCVFGGKLTAYRYPENDFVSVDAKKAYYEGVFPDMEDAA